MLQHLVDAIRIEPTFVLTDVPSNLFKDPHACWMDSVVGLSPQSMHANMSLLVLHVIKTGTAKYKECLVFLMYA